MLRRVAKAPCPDWKGDVTSFGGNTEKEEKGERGGVRWERGDYYGGFCMPLWRIYSVKWIIFFKKILFVFCKEFLGRERG